MILGTYAPGEALIESLSNPSAYVPPPAVVVDSVGGRALQRPIAAPGFWASTS